MHWQSERIWKCSNILKVNSDKVHSEYFGIIFAKNGFNISAMALDIATETYSVKMWDRRAGLTSDPGISVVTALSPTDTKALNVKVAIMIRLSMHLLKWVIESDQSIEIILKVHCADKPMTLPIPTSHNPTISYGRNRSKLSIGHRK